MLLQVINSSPLQLRLNRNHPTNQVITLNSRIMPNMRHSPQHTRDINSTQVVTRGSISRPNPHALESIKKLRVRPKRQILRPCLQVTKRRYLRLFRFKFRRKQRGRLNAKILSRLYMRLSPNQIQRHKFMLQPRKRIIILNMFRSVNRRQSLPAIIIRLRHLSMIMNTLQRRPNPVNNTLGHIIIRSSNRIISNRASINLRRLRPRPCKLLRDKPKILRRM